MRIEYPPFVISSVVHVVYVVYFKFHVTKLRRNYCKENRVFLPTERVNNGIPARKTTSVAPGIHPLTTFSSQQTASKPHQS